MNREDIIRMANEAGGWGDDAVSFCEFAELERFAQLVATHEREQCAKIVNDIEQKSQTSGRIIACQQISERIRARAK